MQGSILSRYSGFFIIVVAISLTFLFVIPQFEKVKMAREQLSQEKIKIAKLQTKVAALEGLNEYEISEKVQTALKALPARKEVFQAIDIINLLASENGLVIDNLSVSPGEISDGEATPTAELKKDLLSFKLELVGDPEGFQKFLTRLAQFIPLADSKKVELGSEGAMNEFSLEFYFAPPPTTLGKTEDSLPTLTEKEEEAYKSISNLPYIIQEETETPIYSSFGRANPFSF